MKFNKIKNICAKQALVEGYHIYFIDEIEPEKYKAGHAYILDDLLFNSSQGSLLSSYTSENLEFFDNLYFFTTDEDVYIKKIQELDL